ncbi:PepSY-like domain-containing protein [Zobellia uliginosa]|uniref:PepSY-like domain-containing protein n=1 Tax=Zobellia uliginosa TaxID=143224 RepID=UPI001C073CF9|nr:PepSY-like domain-containing protein [Zobellia uliginosa]MBU2947898.1 PepSY-like domain-containing protein [Zobellia uliginosa]
MKRIFITAVFALGSLSAFAQQEVIVIENAEVEATEAVATQDDFSEVSSDELPEAVTAAVSKNYPTASIDKAYTNEANQYKLEVSLEDGTAGTLYADENGNWIEM